MKIRLTAAESILHDYLGLRKITCRWVPRFLTEAQKQGRIDYCLAMPKTFNVEAGRDQDMCMTLPLAMKAAFSITIRRRSVKVKFGLQEMIHSQPKFVDNVLFANIFFFMRSGFNTVIPLENGKTVTAKWYTEECLSNVLKQVETHRHHNDLLTHHDNASSHKQWNI